jgi:hypothetical protein
MCLLLPNSLARYDKSIDYEQKEFYDFGHRKFEEQGE